MDIQTLAKTVSTAWLWGGDRDHIRFTPLAEQRLIKEISEVLSGDRIHLTLIRDIRKDDFAILRVREKDEVVLVAMIELAKAILRNNRD